MHQRAPEGSGNGGGSGDGDGGGDEVCIATLIGATRVIASEHGLDRSISACYGVARIQEP